MKAVLGCIILYGAAMAIVFFGMWLAQEAEVERRIIVGIGTGLLIAGFFPAFQYGERFIMWIGRQVQRH